MPTYQYACTACTEQFEIVQKFTDEALTVCPSCNGALRKVFSAVGIVFKGSGFYRTDNRSSSSSSSTSSSKNGSSDKSDSAKSDSSKSDSSKSDSSGTPAVASTSSS